MPGSGRTENRSVKDIILTLRKKGGHFLNFEARRGGKEKGTHNTNNRCIITEGEGLA